MKTNNIDPSKVKVLKHERPEGAKAKSVMNLEFTVDAKKQELSKTIKSFASMEASIPPFFPPEAHIVLQALFSCFEQQKHVKEGVARDLIWGFAQGGIPTKLTLAGLNFLFEQKFLLLRAPDNSSVEKITDDKHLDSTVVYTDKILNLIYEGNGAKPDGSITKKSSAILSEIGLNEVIPDEDITLK